METLPGVPADREAEREVLLLSPFFAPELISTGKYNTYLARGLVNAGYRVRVICSHPLYPNWQVTPAEGGEVGMQIERGGTGMRYPKSTILRRLMLEGWYAWHVRRTLRRQASNASLIVLILPPVAFALALGSLRRQGHVVGVVHDLYGIMATSSSGWPRRLVAKAIGWVERLVLHRCHRLIALSSSMREVLHQRYAVADERIRVAYPFETLGELEHSTDALAAILPDGQLHVVYSGALGEKQMPELLLAVFAQLVASHDHIVCHFFSAGPKFEALQATPTADHERIRFHPLVAEAHLCELYARSTLQVIPQAPGTGAGAFPSKLPNLVAAGVPIFALCDGDSELAQVIGDADAGAVLTSDDPRPIAEAIASTLEATRHESREARRQRLRPYVDQHFRVRGLLDKLGVVSAAKDG